MTANPKKIRASYFSCSDKSISLYSMYIHKKNSPYCLYNVSCMPEKCKRFYIEMKSRLFLLSLIFLQH